MLDPYYKKRITYTLKSHLFQFDIAHTIFSSFEVDKGTDLLLRTIDISPPKTILDLGCGCGIIGIVLAHHFPLAQVTLIDKDLLAVRYATHNCKLNNTPSPQVIASVGMEHIPTDVFYDVIVSNIPAKIGDEAIEQEFILEPLKHLSPDGTYWFVVVSRLNHLIPKIGTRHTLRLKEIKKRSGHTVYRVN